MKTKLHKIGLRNFTLELDQLALSACSIANSVDLILLKKYIWVFQARTGIEIKKVQKLNLENFT